MASAAAASGVMFPGMMGPMDMGLAGGAFNPYMMPTMPFTNPQWF